MRPDHREFAEHSKVMSADLIRIREMLIIQHQSWFFEGDVHHVNQEEDQESKVFSLIGN